jgi:hypothetical protein
LEKVASGAFSRGTPLSILYFRFAARSSDGAQRSPMLERLVARAGDPSRVEDWRTEAFRVIAPGVQRLPSIAATIVPEAGSGADSAAWACIATPVHLSAGMRSVTMAADGILNLAPVEAAALSAGFNRVFGGAGVRLSVGREALLCCLFDDRIEAVTRDPAEVAGNDVFGFQPRGPDGGRLRRLMSEMEMWLFDHPVNRTRSSQARQPVTGLWLWGGGPTGEALPLVRGWCAGQDPFFAAFGSEHEFPRAAGDGVVVCGEQPGSNEWREVERRWLVPAVAALREGRLQRLDLSAADRRFSVGKGVSLRFWRRPRPWWESYGIQ